MPEIDYKQLYVNRIKQDIIELIEFLTSKDVSEEHLRAAFLEEIRKDGRADRLKALLE